MTKPIPKGIPNSVLDGTFYLDTTRFDSTISSIGVNMLWRKSHICPCGGTTGSPDPLCQQCGGVGRYWDTPSAEFVASISFMYPDDPSSRTNFKLGSFVAARPVLTIPQIAGIVWDQASVYDLFVLPDMTQRFTVNLTNPVDGNSKANSLPYNYGVNVPVSGAVFWYDSQTKQISADNNYLVETTPSGITYVSLTDQGQGIPFSVEYTANQAYVAYERGSMPHIRPEVGGFRMPRRFQIQPLDIWTRGLPTIGNQ